ncbi:MAG: hypothetical protein N7Q72_02715, partial [Spiroplasma sp. Tabriz.8]|nr:hypothetical protein [Spiroplasma sp. Tabriz.8]
SNFLILWYLWFWIRLHLLFFLYWGSNAKFIIEHLYIYIYIYMKILIDIPINIMHIWNIVLGVLWFWLLFMYR